MKSLRKKIEKVVSTTAFFSPIEIQSWLKIIRTTAWGNLLFDPHKYQFRSIEEVSTLSNRFFQRPKTKAKG